MLWLAAKEKNEDVKSAGPSYFRLWYLVRLTIASGIWSVTLIQSTASTKTKGAKKLVRRAACCRSSGIWCVAYCRSSGIWCVAYFRSSGIWCVPVQAVHTASLLPLLLYHRCIWCVACAYRDTAPLFGGKEGSLLTINT